MNNIKLSWKVACIIILFFTGTFSYAQHPEFRTYSDDDGLPSNDVFDILSSRDGFMWFSTDNGVSRYDGNVFMNLSVADGLQTNAIIKLYEDYRGRIWFLANNGMLSYYDGGDVFIYRFNDSIVKYFHDNYISKIYIDTLENIMFSPRRGGKGVIDKNGNVLTRSHNTLGKTTDSCYFCFEEKHLDFFMTLLNSRPGICDEKGLLSICGNTYCLKTGYNGKQFHRNYIKIGKDEYVVSFKDEAFYIKDGEVLSQRRFDDEILALYQDKEGHLFLSLKYDGGLYRFHGPDMKGDYDHFLQGTTVSSFVEDVEGGYWIGTIGRGILFLPGFNFNNFLLPDGSRRLSVMEMTLAGDRLWFSTREKEVYFGELHEGNITNIKELPIEKPYDWIKSIAIDHEGYLWLSSTRHMRYDPAGFPKPPDTVITSNFLGKIRGDTIVLATNKLAYYYGSKLIRFIVPDSARRIYSSLHTDDVTYLGTLYGLHIFDHGRMINISKGRKQISERINVIQAIDDKLIIGTASHGVIILRNDTIVNSISDTNGLIDNNVKVIYIENDSTLWVGTKEGLNKIIFGDGDKDIHLENYSTIDGLPSNEIYGILKHDGFIWLATSNGLSSFDPVKLKPFTLPPTIRINSVYINGRDTIINDEYILNHDQNDIRIDFSGITFRHKSELRYRYMLSNYNDKIIPTKNNWANFPNLPPGDYTFFVNVGNSYNVWNAQPKIINFSIKKHFTQTVWFIALLILFSSTLIVATTFILQKQKKIKESARMDMARMEQKIFRLQMNPHFVFNALLAIQGYMYQQNTREAGRYLTSFAKLIRHTLYGSREEQVPLSNELEAMKYYLELQRLRFNDNFEFQIDIGENVFPEVIKIPPLLIQPFLENAIEHGLQHKKEGGRLKLAISQERGVLQIDIEDNGIGREAAQLIQKKKGRLHKSLGMEIVKSRLESLNKVMGKRIQLDIIDLKNEGGDALGTRIRISMPV